MLKRIFVGFGILFIAGAVFAQAYRWVDENGVVHFSDRPVPGAEEIELPRSNTISPAPRRTTTSRRSSTSSSAAAATVEQQGPFRYDSINVASPAAEETLWNIGGVLNVTIDLQPSLQAGHMVRIYFDGEQRMVNGTSFQLEEVWRGVHNLQAEILDAGGEMMIRSVPNRFYVQQTNIN